MKPGRPICISLTLFATQALRAATNSGASDDQLVLSPPYPELPPTFWEQHSVWIVLAAVALLALVSFTAWWCLRAKPSLVLPPEVIARQDLEALRQRLEDGPTLSQVSRALRRYIAVAFELPTHELVTSEFSRLLAGHEKVGPELAAAVGEFLRRCDERKFAPSVSPASMGAAACALELVELGEARRARLRETAQAAVAGQSTQRA